jgi:spermidine synthase
MTPETASPPSPTAQIRRGVYLLFLLSGASGLLFETLWTYQATLALGSSYWAVTAVLSAFMAGLSLGNLLSLRRSAWKLSTYAILEGVILATGPAALALLPLIGRLTAPVFGAVADHPALVHGLRFALSFGVLAVPSTAMGMTLPALAQALGGELGSFRSILGRLYGLNTLGAIVGVLSAELVFLPRMGVFGTATCAAGLNGIAALGAWGLSGRLRANEVTTDVAWDRKIPAGLIPSFVVVFLTGFVLLALEVVWTRFLSLFVSNNSLSFALMLAVVLAGIALGGIAGSAAWIRKPFAFLLLFGAGLAVIGSYAGFPWYRPSSETFVRDPAAILGMGFLLQFPVSFLSGIFFTSAGAAFRERIASSQASAGLLALFNTAGAAAGAVVAGFLLVPRLGVEKSFFVLSMIYGLSALLWFRATGGNRRWGLVGVGTWCAGLALFPFGHFEQRHIPAAARPWTSLQNSKLEAVREGLFETNLYVRTERFGQLLFHRLVSNSFSMSANNVASDRYMREFVYWPMALHPAPRRALLICFGMGNTARALVRTRELERIDVVDLSPDILELSSIVFPDPESHPLRDRRVNVHVEDGRFFMQTRRETWDLITGEPPPPDHPGVAGLYSREYFELMKNHLSEGGIATYWLPIHTVREPAARSVMKAWSEVFDTCFLWRAARKDLMLVGYRGRPARVDEERFKAQWKDPQTRSEMIEVGFDFPELLGTGFVGDAPYIRSQCADAEPTLDAYPKRIAAGGPAEEKMFETWFDAEASADRFLKSSSIAEIWPASLKERTIPYFKWEVSLTSLGSYPWRSRFPPFSEFHRLCTTTPLKSLVLWALDSDRDLVRVAERAAPVFQNQPMVHYHLAARALSDREYARAADHFLKTVGIPGMRKIDLAFCLYTLCMSGRKDEAEQVLAATGNDSLQLLPPDYWSWMKATFGLKTPTDRR